MSITSAISSISSAINNTIIVGRNTTSAISGISSTISNTIIVKRNTTSTIIGISNTTSGIRTAISIWAYQFPKITATSNQ